MSIKEKAQAVVTTVAPIVKNVFAGWVSVVLLLGILAVLKLKFDFPAYAVVRELVVISVEVLGFHQLGKILVNAIKKKV